MSSHIFLSDGDGIPPSPLTNTERKENELLDPPSDLESDHRVHDPSLEGPPPV